MSSGAPETASQARREKRPIPDPSVIEGSSRMKGPLFGTCRSVVNPEGRVLFFWLTLVTICVLYNAWTVVARQAFPELQEYYCLAWFCLDSFTDLVFVLDIAFQFRTGYWEQGMIVCESRKLAGHYLRSKSFLMDIVAIMPIDLIQLKVGILPIVRIPRFLKAYRSFRFYCKVESLRVLPTLWCGVNLIHILHLLEHWSGCFYYMLSELNSRPTADNADFFTNHLLFIYWSTTIRELPPSVTALQFVFEMASNVIGFTVYLTIIGLIVLTHNRDSREQEFERELDEVKSCLRREKVSEDFEQSVLKKMEYVWSRGKGCPSDVNTALFFANDRLKADVALGIHGKTLKKVSIFQECHSEVLRDIVLKMKVRIYAPGDFIYRKGEDARAMFIISDGILEEISETGQVLKQMKAGDHFGAIGILNLENRRTADVRSVSYSEVFELYRRDILAAMNDYPEALPVHEEGSEESEFPPSPGDMTQEVSSTPSQISITVPETSLPDSEEDDQMSDTLPYEQDQTAPEKLDDWETRLLVQEFEKNMRQQLRRHLSGKAPPWNKGLRNVDAALKPRTRKLSKLQQTSTSKVFLGRGLKSGGQR